MELEQCTTLGVAQRLNVDRTTVIRLVNAGALVPVAKLPGRTGAYLFDADDVEAFAGAREAVAR